MSFIEIIGKGVTKKVAKDSIILDPFKNGTRVQLNDEQKYSADMAVEDAGEESAVGAKSPYTELGAGEFSNEEYRLPNYKPKFNISAEELKVRQLGEVLQYTVGNAPVPADTARKFGKLLQDRMALAHKRVMRGVTSQAAQVWETGVFSSSEFSAQTYTNTAHAGLFVNNLGGGTINWSDSSATPLTDLDDFSQRISEADGITPNIVILGKDAKRYFLNNTSVQKAADVRRVDFGAFGNFEANPANGEFLGRYVINGSPMIFYCDHGRRQVNGTLTYYVDPNKVIMLSNEGDYEMVTGYPAKIAVQGSTAPLQIVDSVNTSKLMEVDGLQYHVKMGVDEDNDNLIVKMHTKVLLLPRTISYGCLTIKT